MKRLVLVVGLVLLLTGLSLGVTVYPSSGGSQDTYNNYKPVKVSSASGSPSVAKAQPVNLTCGADSATGTGQIVIDCSNVGGVEDIDFSNTTDYRLDYEIEFSNLSNGGDALVWVYDDWTRDGSEQVRVHYGNGSTNEEDVTGTWSNSGQNAVLVQHLQDSPLTATDSTSNNFDGTITGASSTGGHFDGAGSFGTSDDITFASTGIVNTDSDFATAMWFKDPSSSSGMMWSKYDASFDGADARYDINSNGGIRFAVNSDSANSRVTVGSSLADGSWHLAGQSWDESATTQTAYIDTSSGSDTSSVGNSQDGDGYLWLNANAAGTNPADSNYLGMDMDAFRVFQDAKSSDWYEAEYDASPKGGQTFFSQEAGIGSVITVNDSITPDPPLIGNSVSYSANASSSSGLVDSINLLLDFKGSQVYNRTHRYYDGFERSTDLSAEDPYKWNKIVGSGSSDDFTVNNTRSYSGSQSLRMERTAGEGNSYIWTERDNKNDISSRNFTAYAYDNGDDVGANLGVGNFDEGTQSFNGGAVFANIRANDTIIGSIDTGGSIVAYESGPETVQGNWYRIEMDIYPDKDYALVSIVNMTDGAVHQSENISIGSAFSSADDTVMGANAPGSGTGVGWMDDVSVEPEMNQTSFNSVYTPSSEGWLNATFTAKSDDGDNSTELLNRFLSDDAPSISFNLSNTTYLDFNQTVSVTPSDSDSKPSETITCDLYIDNSQFDSQSVTEGNTFNSDFSTDLGSHSFKASCTDPAGNTNNKTEYFTISTFEFNTVSSDSSTFETVNQDFASTHDVGDMVIEVDFYLDYDSNIQADASKTYGTGTHLGDSVNIFHDIGLVGSDGVSKNWFVKSEISYFNYSGSLKSKNKTSSTKTQTVDRAYTFKNHEMEDGFTQLEASKLEYTATVNNKSQDARGTITGETEYSQTSTLKNLQQGNGLNYSTSFLSDLINSNSATFNLDTTFNLSFQNQYRTFSNNKDVTLLQLQLSNNSNNGAETLLFHTQDEVNKTDVKSDLELGLKVSNPDQPSKERFYGFDLGGEAKHSLYLSPTNATAKVNAFEKESIEYQNRTLNYPKRRHYLIDQTIDNQTTVVDLFMLEGSEASNVIIELLDTDFEPLEQHVIRIERNFPSQNTTTTVAMVKTGAEGEANVQLDPDEQYIFTVFNEEGKLIDQIGPQSITQLSVTLTVDEEIPDGLENLVNQVRFTDITKKNNNLIVDYISETERLNNITLRVKTNDLFTTNVIDTDSSQDLQGQLKASGFNASKQDLYYELEGTFGEKTFILDSGEFGTNVADYGNAGIFMSLLIFLTLSVTGVWRPSASIGLGLVAVFMSAFIGFISLSQTALISIAALGMVLIWRLS